MKAISLTQPWASLVAVGAKRIETRSWKTAYRGPLAIHAAKAFPAWARELLDSDLVVGALAPLGVASSADWERLPRGAIVAEARLVDIVSTESGDSRLPSVGTIENMVGDFSRGRWAWVLADVVALTAPFAWRGALGLWDVDPIEIAYPGPDARVWCVSCRGRGLGVDSALCVFCGGKGWNDR